MPPLVDASDIIRLVGPGAFTRAKEYVRGGAVLETKWDDAGEVVTGTVQGGAPHPYRCRVTLTPTHGDYRKPVRGSCTCPVQEDCKHVAATLLASNGGAVKQTVGRVRTAAELDWKTQVAGLAGASAQANARTVPLGLQFELREQTHASRGPWDAPKSRAALAGRDPEGQVRLAVRPVLQSATGNWVRRDLTWSSMRYKRNRLEADAEQHAWFAQFAALHRSDREAFSFDEADWLSLDQFASPLLWPLLAEGQRLGIAFVTGKKETEVEVGREARVGIDIARVPSGGLDLTASVVVDGLVHPTISTRPIGDHGVYVFALRPRPHFVLAPTAAAISDDQRGLLSSPKPISVPEADADEFLEEWYPRLRSTVEVASRDDSVELPEILPPRLQLTATFSGDDTLRLVWRWRSAAGIEPATAHPAPEGVAPYDATLKGVEAAEYATHELPPLERRDDVDVIVTGARPDYRELTGAPDLTVTTVETDRRDWFDLGVLVTVEGHTVPFGPLFTALAKRRVKLLLPDKTYLSLLHPAFNDLRRLIDEADALGEWETGLRISRYQADLWAEIEEMADHTEQADAWRRSVGGLLALESLPSPEVPASVDATLRPYQVDGFAWLTFLLDHDLGGILADDMGLGKTLQTLAALAHFRTAHHGAPPFLVVAPTSVVSNWAAEAARFTPGLVVRTVTATEAKSAERLTDATRGADVIVTSYALFRLDFAAYQAEKWSGLILDEAQFVKNRASKAHRCAVELDTPFKLAITGTPLENSLMDLWALLHIVAPGLLGSGTRFTEDYAKPIATGEKPNLLAKLRRRIRPLMMRRTKELVASDLPAKQEQVLRVDLHPEHRDLYDKVLQRERQKLLGLVEDLDRNRFIVFRSLTLLRLLSLDAALIDVAYDGIASAKTDALLDELDDVVAGGHRALVFSQFTSYLQRVATRLEERGIAHDYLDGSTLRRSEVIDRFKRGTAPAFLISLKAGGFGLNLTEADYVFLLDPWWNPAAESQAVDRTHRIGQSSNVMVYRMIANDTIEEKVMALQESKSRLFDAVMDDSEAAFGHSLTADDLRGLLE